MRKLKGAISPFVEISIIGLESDAQRNRTKTVTECGFNPIWNEGLLSSLVDKRQSFAFPEYEYKVSFPDVAAIQFVVYDEDMFGEPNPIAVSVLPFGSITNPGVRRGAYLNIFSDCHNIVARSAVGAAQERLRRGYGALDALGQGHKLVGR